MTQIQVWTMWAEDEDYTDNKGDYTDNNGDTEDTESTDQQNLDKSSSPTPKGPRTPAVHEIRDKPIF
jgi:hypothetical protein